MNVTDELYIWRTAMGKLYSVEDFITLHTCGSVEDIWIVFPAGSYRRVFDEHGMEYFPSTRGGLLWLRGQSCTCQSFDMENKYKRPAVIRKHFISCKFRVQQFGWYDPIATCCWLWENM
ncbi:hypothetical protein BT69DRAFT_1275363 [Atractiella rhizophila]|nr:hypothetical protein BT69DRAFT_1275363 [Atractiella rhizophila]